MLSNHSSPSTNPIAPAATASAATANPVSATAPPVVTFVGQSIEDVLSDLVELYVLEVIVEFMVMLPALEIVELESETELESEQVAGGRVVTELAALAEDDSTAVTEVEAVSPAPTFDPQ